MCVIGRSKVVPSWFARVHHKTCTPVNASAFLGTLQSSLELSGIGFIRVSGAGSVRITHCHILLLLLLLLLFWYFFDLEVCCFGYWSLGRWGGWDHFEPIQLKTFVFRDGTDRERVYTVNFA